METQIENNLISFSDVAAISDIKSLNQRMALLHMPYKQVLNLTNTQENIQDGQLFNMNTNKQLRIDGFRAIELFESIDAYCKSATPENSGNACQLFLPLAEIPQPWSCPTFIVRFPGGATTVGSNKYVVDPEFHFCKGPMCSSFANKFAKFLKKMGKLNNFSFHVAFLFRMRNMTDLDVKIQFLDVSLSRGASKRFIEDCQGYISEMISGKYPLMKFSSEMYNEIYVTNTNPSKKRWAISHIVKAGYSDCMPSNQFMDVQQFLGSIKPISGAFTVNDYGLQSFPKMQITTEHDSEIVDGTQNMETQKLQLICENRDARYYSIILDSLPADYRTDYNKWASVTRSFKDRRDYRVLLHEFAKETPFASDFKRVWNNNDTTGRVPAGYFYQECLRIPGFEESIHKFYRTLLEVSLYDTSCNISSMVCATIISMFTNGLFYLTNDGKDEKWWRFIGKHQEEKEGEIYKWKEIQAKPYFLHNIIRSTFKNMFDVVKNKIELDIADRSNHKKLFDSLTTSKNKFEKLPIYNEIIEMIKPRIYWNNIANVLDSYKDVVGTKNGVLYLDLESADPRPRLITGYSKYFVTKWANANYIPYDPDNEYVKLWRQIYKDIFIEPDVCQFIWYMLSTGMDQIAKVWKILQIVAGGSNGKSVALDNPLYVYNTYAVKLRPDTITAKNKPGAADENLMDLKGHNLGIITETNEGDELVSSRIKEVTEYVKRSRGLYAKNESFETNITVILASNFPLIIDNDGGTDRRLLFVNAKSVFRDNPDPENPFEKKVNRSYETLAMTNPKAADALFSILAYERCELQRLYKSNMDIVPIPTIDAETQIYKTDQNYFAKFLCTRLVNMYGYNPDGRRRKEITEDQINEYYTEKCVTRPEKLHENTIGNAFISWAKKYNERSITLDAANKKIRNSKLAKYLINSDELYGYRILGETEKKFAEEYYFTL